MRRARGRRERPTQKQVDVMIAGDLLLHTFRCDMDQATLLASDLDLAPLLHALVREGMFVTLWYPPAATTPEPRAAADTRREFSRKTIAGSLVDEAGRPFLPYWQTGPVHFR